MIRNPKHLLVRTDAYPEIGAGHAMRCLAFAQCWMESGGTVSYAGVSQSSWGAGLFGREGADLSVIEAEPGTAKDALMTRGAADEGQAGWLVLDAPYFDLAYQEMVKESGVRLLLIDDNGDRDGCAGDIICNPNLHADASLYQGAASKQNLLLGPEYVFLRREFRRQEGRSRDKRAECPRVLVTFGGSDPENITGQVLRALEKYKTHRLQVRVIIGAGNPQPYDKYSSGNHQVEIIRAPKNMAEEMNWADVALSAAGSTCWELLHLGVPFAVVPAAANQEGIVKELRKRGLAQTIPWDGNEIRGMEAILESLFSTATRVKMEEGKRLIDGQGCARVMNKLWAWKSEN